MSPPPSSPPPSSPPPSPPPPISPPPQSNRMQTSDPAPTAQAILQSWIPNLPTNLSLTPSGPHQHRLTTTTTLSAETPVLSIPDTHIITTSISLTSPLVQTALSHHPAPAPTTGSQAALLLFVLLCRNEPFYRPYFASIPPRIVTATTSKTVRKLEGTPLCPLSLALRQQLDELYHTWFSRIKASFPQFAHVDRQEFLYAHAVLESRAISYGRITHEQRERKEKPDHEQSIILPLIDFCNHSVTPNCYLNASYTSLTLFTNREILEGEELTICYGKLPNLLLLLHWGFAIPENPFDEIRLSLEEPEDMARHIILSVLVGDPEFVLTLDDPLPKPLLRAIRILVVADVTNGVKRNFDVPLKKQETRVLAVLRELVQSVRCPETPVKEDEDAADDDLPVEDLEFERFCKIYRDGIDQILNAAEAKIADMEKAITD